MHPQTSGPGVTARSATPVSAQDHRVTYPAMALDAARARRAAGVTDDFQESLKAIARRLLFSAIGLGDGERDLLHDIIKGRYPMKTLQRMASIAARSVRIEDREALPEMIRGECHAGLQAIHDRHVAGEIETSAQGPHDLAWRAFEIHPTRVTRERATETAVAHIAGLHAQMGVLHLWSI
jgi:hypothetical protein